MKAMRVAYILYRSQSERVRKHINEGSARGKGIHPDERERERKENAERCY